MPIYEYTCKSCDTRFEQLVRSMRTDAKFKCPSCGSDQTTRAVSVFAVSGESAKASGGDDVPMCGRCGGPPGSCGIGEMD